MVIPTGTDVQIDLKSLDVLHGFYVPEFNFSRYASPGYTTTFDFNVLHTGDFRGQCTQLCGLYHSLMFFNVKAVTQAQYADLAPHTAGPGEGQSLVGPQAAQRRERWHREHQFAQQRPWR